MAIAVTERFQVRTNEFLKNAGSSPPPVVKAISKEFGTNPIAVAAEQCGYVKRNRLFRGRCGERTLEGFADSQDCIMPSMCSLEPRNNDPLCSFDLRYSGTKPIPAAVHIDSHYSLPFDPRTLVKEGGDKALYPFVRCFPHPEDLCHRATPEAVERFRQDNRRYPPAAYEARNLLWRGEEWRQPSSRERACIHEVPFDILKPCDTIQDPDLREASRASLLGNGWHMGTFLVVLFMRVQLGESRAPPSLDASHHGFNYFDVEEGLRARVSGTEFEPGRLSSMEGKLSSSDILNSMQRQLPFSFISEKVWRRTAEAMSHIPEEQFQLFWAYQKIRGKDSDVLPPEWHAQRRRAQLFAATGRAAAADSKMGLDHVLPPPAWGSWVI